MKMHHKNCGGEFKIKEWTDYGPEYGKLPDFYCDKCGEFLSGDKQVTSDDPFFNACYGEANPLDGESSTFPASDMDY